jgi:F0F1-type ATP synthase membrane subunit b/b'
MTEHATERPRFAIVVRGYDRTQVEAYLAEYERWASQAQSMIEASDARAATAGRRVQGLETKIAELEERVGDAPPPSVKWLGDRADQIILEAWGASQELRGKISAEIEEAQRHREEAARDLEEARQHGDQLLEEARQHGDQLLEEARRHGDQLLEEAREQRGQQERAAAQLILESQAQADDIAEQGRERAEATIQEAQDRVGEVTEESRLDRLDAAYALERARQQADELVQETEADREEAAAARAEAERVASETIRAARTQAAETVDRARAEAHELSDRAEAQATQLTEESRIDREHAAKLLEEAKAERAEAEDAAAEIVEAAQGRAVAIAEEAERDRDDADRTVAAAHQQLDRFTEETEAAAEDRAHAVMEGSMVHLDVLRRELEQLEELRDDTIGELARLRTSLQHLYV